MNCYGLAKNMMPRPLKRWIDVKGMLFETANEIPKSERYALDKLAYGFSQKL